MDTPTALITGASRGLGRALAAALNDRGWRLVIDGRDARRLAATAAALPRPESVVAIPGDVADPAHRAALATAVGPRLDLLVNNASALGPSPLPRLVDLRPEEFTRVLARVLHRPAVMVVPETALRLVYGQMADEAILASTHVVPTALQSSGFGFRYPSLEPALVNLLQA